MSSRENGLNITFTNETGRDFTINVVYPGSPGWNPATGNKTFTIEKLATQTLVDVTSSTTGNLQISVVVNDTDRNKVVNTGTLEVTYDGQTHTIMVNSTGTTIIPISIENPGSSCQ